MTEKNDDDHEKDLKADFDVGRNILTQLLRLRRKSALTRNGKVYAETRRLELGDYLLCPSLTNDLGLGKESHDANDVLDCVVAQSTRWPFPLSRWDRESSDRVRFFLDRPRCLQRVLRPMSRKALLGTGPGGAESSKGSVLIVCDLNCRKRSTSSSTSSTLPHPFPAKTTSTTPTFPPLSLSDLRCILHSVSHRRRLQRLGQKVDLVFWPRTRLFEGKDSLDLLMGKDNLINDIREPSNASLTVLEWFEAASVRHSTFDECVDDECCSERFENERQAGFATTSTTTTMATPTQLFQKIVYFFPRGMEHRAKRLFDAWEGMKAECTDVISSSSPTDLSKTATASFQSVVVGGVKPDRPVIEEWNKLVDFVREVTEERELPGVVASEEKIRSLASTSLKFELLKKSPSGNLSFRPDYADEGHQKGGLFLLYNYARINRLLSEHESRVKDGFYPDADFGNVDVSKLSDEAEWSLAFKYLVQSIFEENPSADIETDPGDLHKLVQKLSAFGQDFSRYYNRVHVLSDPKDHLYPKMVARLVMAKALKQYLDDAFDLLGVVPVDEM